MLPASFRTQTTVETDESGEDGARTYRHVESVPTPNRAARGVPTWVTADVRAVCRSLVEDRAYREEFRDRLIAGELPPVLECLLWHFVYGKPKTEVEITIPGGDRTVRFEVLAPRPGGGDASCAAICHPIEIHVSGTPTSNPQRSGCLVCWRRATRPPT